LRDDQTGKIGDSASESALQDVTNMSAVSISDYADYQRALAAGLVTAHAKRDGYIYYAVQTGLDAPFPNGSRAWVGLHTAIQGKDAT
jgi:hypothetical protein